MRLAPLLDVLESDPAVARVLENVGSAARLDVAAAPGLRAALAALLRRRSGQEAAPLLMVTATGREAQDLTAGLRTFLPESAVAEMPSWETLPHERLSPRSDTVGRRLAVLRRLTHPSPDEAEHGPIQVLVVSVRALMQPLAKGLGDLEPVALQVGQDRPLEDVVEALAGAAYTRTDMVERRGDFAVRGGIIDVFPPTEQHPVRVEFFGDTVDEIRAFKVADQRSTDALPHGLWAPPCRELLLTEDVRARAAELAEQLPGVADLLHKVAEGIAVEGMESLSPALLADGMESLLDVLPASSTIVLSDPERVRTRATDLVATSAEFLGASWANAAAGNQVPVDLEAVLGTASYWGLVDLREHALERGQAWWSFSSFAGDSELDEFVDLFCRF